MIWHGHFCSHNKRPWLVAIQISPSLWMNKLFIANQLTFIAITIIYLEVIIVNLSQRQAEIEKIIVLVFVVYRDRSFEIGPGKDIYATVFTAIIIIRYRDIWELKMSLFLGNLLGPAYLTPCLFNYDVIKWKHFPRYWPFVRGIQRSPVNSPHKGQWRGA